MEEAAAQESASQDVPTGADSLLTRLPMYFAIAWFVLFLTFVGYVDFDPEMNKLRQISDYLMTFHTAGYAVVHGQAASLYPPAGATQFAGMPFDQLAHAILPQMPASSVAEFMYMPLAALVFVPFSYLPLSFSLFCWQVVSLLSLCVGIAFLVRAFKIRGSGNEKNGVLATIQACLFTLFLLPACITIWIGQVGLVFGVLPLSIGLSLLLRKKSFWAGLIWSLCLLKPQFLVPISFPLLYELLKKRFGAIVGFIVGGLSIAAASVVLFSAGLNIEWLHCLRVSDLVYSDARSGVARQIATSLPRTLILMVPIEQQVIFKPFIYGIAALILLSGAYLIYRLSRTDQKTEREDTDEIVVSGRSLAVLLGIFVTPLVVPHMFLYDFCIFAPTGVIAFASLQHSSTSARIRQLVISTWLLIDLYLMVVMVATKIAQPLPFVILLFCLYVGLYATTLVHIRAGRSRY